MGALRALAERLCSTPGGGALTARGAGPSDGLDLVLRRRRPRLKLPAHLAFELVHFRGKLSERGSQGGASCAQVWLARARYRRQRSQNIDERDCRLEGVVVELLRR